MAPRTHRRSGAAVSALPARIAFVINSLETGGAERQLALTVAALDSARFQPVVVCLFHGGAFLEEVRRAGVEVHELHLPKDLRTAIRQLPARLAPFRPSLVHTAMFEANVAGRLAARRFGVPAVSHATNLYESPSRYAESPVPGWKLRAARAAERWSSRRSGAHVIAVGEAVAASAARYLRVPAARVVVIRRGYDFARLEEAAARPLETPAWPDEASPRLLTVGRLAPQKGHRFLLEAMPAVLRRHPRAHLALAGTGPLEEDLRRRAAALGVEPAVSFLGVRRDVPTLLREADAFPFPSLWEGAANALVEAMGLGVPVAVTDDAPLREIALDGAEYFAPRDSTAIAAAIDRIAADGDGARTRAEAAVTRVRAAHDLARNTRALEDLYERLLAPP